MKQPIHKVGDQIYIGTSLHIDRGEDDVHGGIATIKSFEIKDYPNNPINNISVDFEEISGHKYNYQILLQSQDKWKQEFGEGRAYNDPDV